MAYNKKKWIFTPGQDKPFKMSRSKLDMFVECPRCFYLDQRLGIKRPSWPAFTLNIAVDRLLKSEFDVYRAEGEQHPLMKTYGIKALPFEHPKMDEWRHNFKGVRVWHKPTNLIIYGAVDDIWVTPNKVLVVVDYKSTSTSRKIDLDSKYKKIFKRQMEIYQWLLRKQEELIEKGYRVSDKGFFVYVNARKDKKAFDGRLEFDVQLISYIGDSGWVEETIRRAHQCLMHEHIPAPSQDCEYCQYRKKASHKEKWQEK